MRNDFPVRYAYETAKDCPITVENLLDLFARGAIDVNEPIFLGGVYSVLRHDGAFFAERKHVNGGTVDIWDGDVDNLSWNSTKLYYGY